MDLTSLMFIAMLTLTFVGVDSAWHPVSVVLDAAVPAKLDNVTTDPTAINEMLTYEVSTISSTPTMLAVPEIRVGANKSLGMAIAQAFNMQQITLALQARLGNQPEQIRLTLMKEDGAIKMLVTGSGLGGMIATPPFQESLVLRQDETLSSLVHRSAIVGLGKIDPYITSLYLVESHAGDRNFADALALIEKTSADLAPTPLNRERALLENLQGIIALFQNQPQQANQWFHRATTSAPKNVVIMLNMAFTDIQQKNYQDAIGHIDALLTGRVPADPTLLSTAYLTAAAAQLGLHDFDGVDRHLAKAVAINPENSTAFELWSQAKQVAGDTSGAEAMHLKALETSGTFENYAEVAALYFLIPWRGEAIVRNPFANPGMIRFN